MRSRDDRDGRDEQDLNDEIRFHLAEETRQRVEAGMSPEDAAAAARRDFGNVTLVTEVTRGMWGARVLDATRQDLRYGLRLLARHRLFAIFSIISLALGIGATSAVFSLFDAIVLRDLPVTAPERLITLSIQTGARPSNSWMPYPQFDAMRRDSKFVEGLFARTNNDRIRIGVPGATTEIASGLQVTGSYHGTLGLRPALGRLLTPADDRPGHAAVAVLSHAYWQRRFGGSASIVGSTITVNQAPFTVVGVEPPGFFGVTLGAAPDVVIPMQAAVLVTGAEPPWGAAFATWIQIMGRLRGDASIEQATEELTAIYTRVSIEAAGRPTADSGDARLARETKVLVRSGAKGGVSGLRNTYESGLRLLLMMLGGIRYEGTAAEVLRAATAAMNRVDPELTMVNARTLDVETQRSFARERLLALLATYFGAFALLLAGVGLYGLMTCTVTERTRELGLRIALGARPSGIRWGVLGDGARTVLFGLAAGLAGAVAAARLARTLLFQVEPVDPIAIAGAMAVLLVLAFAACFIPAHRASRIDPMTALRQE